MNREEHEHIRNDFDLLYKYNSKSKIYPDGTVVSLYCNRPKFCMISGGKKKKRETEKYTPEYWNSLGYFDCVSLFHGWYFDYSVNRFAFDEHYAPHFKPLELEHPYICADPETGEVMFRNPAVMQMLRERKETKRRADNVKRSNDKVFDIAMLNKWDYFVTLTLGNNERFDPSEAKQVIKPVMDWLHNMSRRKDLKYLLVPEYQPVSGYIHFHGLFKGNIKVVDSGTRDAREFGYDKPVRISTLKYKKINPDFLPIVYNLPEWKFGFTTATPVYSVSPKLINYLIKYITKDTQKIFGHNYWASKKGLLRECDMFYEDVDYYGIKAPEYSIPRTKDKYKYYTFFPGQNYFHWEEEYKEERRRVQENTEAILYELNNAFIDVSEDFIPFEEV